MAVSVRSYLTAGMAALAASAVVVAPVHPPLPSSISADAVRLSTAVQPLLQPANAAAAVLGLVSPPAPAKPAAAAATTTPQAAATANATGDLVINAWNFADYWINYAADLTQYVLSWLWPLNYIGDQAPILWDNLGSPIGDATVYGLIVPVLNHPLDLSVWVAGLTYVAQASWTALVNTAVAEVNYFLGWLLPPLPPLPIPPFPFAAVPTVPTALAAAAPTSGTTAQASQTVAPSDGAASGTGHTRRDGVVAQVKSAVAAAADAVDSTAKTIAAPPKIDTTDQGAGAGSHSDTPKAASTVSDAPDAGSGATDAGASTGKSGPDNAKKTHATGGSARDRKARAGS